MDFLQQLGVKIDTKAGETEPTVLVSHVQSLGNWRTPARKSMVFPIRNPFPEKKEKILFEPSDRLPSALRGTTSLGRGEKFYVRIENVSEEEQIFNPDWEIGNKEAVSPDRGRGGGATPIHDEPGMKQRKELSELLGEINVILPGKISNWEIPI